MLDQEWDLGRILIDREKVEQLAIEMDWVGMAVEVTLESECFLQWRDVWEHLVVQEQDDSLGMRHREDRHHCRHHNLHQHRHPPYLHRFPDQPYSSLHVRHDRDLDLDSKVVVVVKEK